MTAATIVSTNCFAADTFSVSLAISTDPSNNVIFWSSIQQAYVEILSSDMTICLITGMTDTISIDVLQGIVRLEGRDLSSLLIDTSPDQDFVNQTASEIVTFIAAKHGLTPVVAPTSSITGRFYGDNFTRLSLSKFSRMRSEWDLMVQLARECEYDIYVAGKNLHFEPSLISGLASVILTPDVLSSLRVERTLWISETPAIRMSAWNSQDLRAYHESAGSPEADSSYVFTGANMTANQVTRDATRYSNEIRRMRQPVSAEVPWIDAINTHTPIYLDGTGVIDGVYLVDHTERQFSTATGARQYLLLSKPID